MSDDLISRKALMEKVLQEEYDKDIHKDERSKAIHHGEYQHFYKTISEMPTAYDADKVIEWLKNLKTYNSCGNCTYKEKCDELEEFYNPDDSVDLCGLTIKELAIEIVKSGGVADE